MKIALLISATMMIFACETTGVYSGSSYNTNSLVDQAAYQCQAYGFPQGTKEFNRCLENLVTQQTLQIEARNSRVHDQVYGITSQVVGGMVSVAVSKILD